MWEKRNWLFGGTLLGWYRQCSIISYDKELDTASWVDDFEEWMIWHFTNHRILKLYEKFGKKDDSLEFKLGDKQKTTIDLFWLHSVPGGKNQSWAGVKTVNGNFAKNVETYPTISSICTADLHGYLVYVPCNAEKVIQSQFGDKMWFKAKSQRKSK